jgi:hypothetical protein
MSSPQSRLAWVNSAEPSRSLDRDDQECQLLARQLTAGLFPDKPIFRLAAQQNEWGRCFGSRGWRQVDRAAAAAVNPPAARTLDANRWIAVSNGQTGTVYLDTTQITKSPGGTHRVWLLHENNDVERFGTLLIRRYIRQVELDCANRQTRNVVAIAYDDAGSPVATERNESAPWIAVVPESIDEGVMRALCPRR